jgi:hypothetical protein
MNARLVFACAADEANIGSIGFGEFDFAGRGESVEIMGTCGGLVVAYRKPQPS